MPDARGSKKGERRGGRQKGTPNKRDTEMVKRAAEAGLLPHEFLAAIARGDQLPGMEGVTFEHRIRCAESASPYFASKRREITGLGGGPLQVIDYSKLSKEQLVALEPVFTALLQSGS